MDALIFAQKINKVDRHDASGAFVPGATRFAKLHHTPPPVWLEDKADRRKMLQAFAGKTGLSAIVYFGHGTPNGLPSAEISKKHIPDLAAAIKSAAAADCRVILYACSAGVQGGFAEQLSNAVGGRVVVFGHTCIGHSFTNPYVTRYPHLPDPQPFLIEPTGKLFRKWNKRIKEDGSDLWARFPFMTKSAVELEVETGLRNAVPPPMPLPAMDRSAAGATAPA